MTPKSKYLFPLFMAILQLSCGKKVDADKNQASMTVLVALDRVFKFLDCIQDILQRTLDISNQNNNGVEEFAVMVNDQTGEQKQVLYAVENNLSQAISAAVNDQTGEQKQVLYAVENNLSQAISDAVKHITDEFKNSKNTDDRLKSELERLAAENEELKRNMVDKEKQVHELSGKLSDSQQTIQDLEANSKQLKFKVQNVSIRLEDSQRKVEELQDNVEQLNLKVASQNKMAEGMRDCIQQQKIKELVEEFNETMDWPAIVTSMKQIIYNDSEAYTQLQKINESSVTSALYQIARYGYTELASLLLAGGLPPDTKFNSEGITMLYAAVIWNQLPLVKLLILHGADIDAQRRPSGMTPLMWAASNGSLDIVKRLVWAGADVTITSEGNTALDIARTMGRHEVVKFLERLQAVSPEDRIQSP